MFHEECLHIRHEKNAKELGSIRSANFQRKAARRMIRVQWYVSAPKTLFVFSCKNIQLCNFYSLLLKGTRICT